MKKMIMTTKDVRIITNKSEGYCRRIIRIIKKELKKEKHQKITIKEFCVFFNLDIKFNQDLLSSFYEKKRAE